MKKCHPGKDGISLFIEAGCGHGMILPGQSLAQLRIEGGQVCLTLILFDLQTIAAMVGTMVLQLLFVLLNLAV